MNVDRPQLLASRALPAVCGWLAIGFVAEITAIHFTDLRTTTTSSGAAALVVMTVGGLVLLFAVNMASAGSGVLVASLVSLAVYGLWFRGFEVAFVESLEGLYFYEIHDGSVQAFVMESPRLHWAIRSSWFGLAIGLFWGLARLRTEERHLQTCSPVPGL